MDDLNGKTAVITGAASGIGRAMAHTLGSAGMKLVVSDVERGALDETRAALTSAGFQVRAVRADVSNADAVQHLAEQAQDAFGALHVVCNNAGVFAGGLSWETSLADYEWVLGVNTWGVIHGIRSFVPILLAQGEPAHVVNTASMAGLTAGPLSGAYFMSKHAVIALSESLYHELAMKQAPIGVSVVCPEMIATRIGQAARNRPPHLKRDPDVELPPETRLVESAIQEAAKSGIDAAVIAERTLDAIRADRFYVLPPAGDPWRVACQSRCDDINQGRNPTLAGPASGEGR